MIYHVFVQEKGKIYILKEWRGVFEKKWDYQKWDYPRYRNLYFKWLEDESGINMDNKILEHYKIHGWRNLVVISKVRTMFKIIISPKVKMEFRFLTIYPLLMHYPVRTFIEEIGLEKSSLSLFVMPRSVVTKLDNTNKMVIPEDCRKFCNIDSYVTSREKIIVVKREFWLEVWDPKIWRITPRVLKKYMGDLTM